MTTSPGRMLVVNAGSSSVKLRVLDGQDRLLASRDLNTAAGQAPDGKELAGFLSEAGALDAVGPPVVPGGNLFSKPVLLDPTVFGRFGSLPDLAPLHHATALPPPRNLGP